VLSNAPASGALLIKTLDRLVFLAIINTTAYLFLIPGGVTVFYASADQP